MGGVVTQYSENGATSKTAFYLLRPAPAFFPLPLARSPDQAPEFLSDAAIEMKAGQERNRTSGLQEMSIRNLAGGDGLMKETFGTRALGILRSHHEAYDMVLFSDFGYTQALTNPRALHTCSCTHPPAALHTCACAHSRAHQRSCTCACDMCMCMHMHMHMRMHMHMYMCMHTCTCHMHMHMHYM